MKEGEKPRLAGIFECLECRARFRAAVELETEIPQAVSIKDMVGKIRGIKDELMLTLMNLREKIKTLETERATLMKEIENLREAAESRADALEDEVTTLKEEVRSLRDLLGNSELQK